MAAVSSTGFTSPTWGGYPAVEIDEATYPAASWLLGHGLDFDTDLNQGLNGDGVSLLMAYALNLDPHHGPRGSMPAVVAEETGMSITFYGVAPGVTYTGWTSTDLENWTTEGVTLSEPDADGVRTAFVERDGQQRFLRFTVEEQ